MMGISPPQISLEAFRQQFPALQNKAYFNYGGQGPMAQAVLEAIIQSYRTLQEVGPFSGEAYAWTVKETEQTRQAIAQELGTTPDTITLTEDVTVGCNIALWGMEWRLGDHLLLTDCEHPGIIAAAKELERRFGIEVSTCPVQATLNQGDPVAVIANHLRPNTRLVVLSHILWNTGQVLPLAEIVAACHSYSNSRPVRVLVDAAQSVGVLPLNLTATQPDFYAFTGHKWWCGPEGLGGLYVHPSALASLSPTFIGWRGITKNKQGFPTGWKSGGERYEIATSAYPLYTGLRTAMALHDQWGTTQERYDRICQLGHYLWHRLTEIPQVHCLRSTAPQSGLVSFQIPNQSHQKLVQFLESRHMLLRTILDPDCVRACVHYFTLESEIDRLVEAIQQFCTLGLA